VTQPAQEADRRRRRHVRGLRAVCRLATGRVFQLAMTSFPTPTKKLYRMRHLRNSPTRRLSAPWEQSSCSTT